MTKRRALLVTYHFPPSGASGAFRLLGFARHLPMYDYEVAVVAPPGIPWEPIDEDLGRQVPRTTLVCHVPYPSTLISKPFRWLFPYAVWLGPAFIKCAMFIKDFRPDIVLTSGPPHCVHLLGSMLKQRLGVPWVADFRDPWVIDFRPRGRKAAVCEYLESNVVRAADAIVCNAPRAQKSMQAMYGQLRGSFTTITNGFDAEAFSLSQIPRIDDKVLIVHAGELYDGRRDPRPFLDAWSEEERAGTARNVRACFVGQLPNRKSGAGLDLQKEISLRCLTDRVELRGQVPYKVALSTMQTADILLLIDTPGRQSGVPAKLYEYIGAGRPILALAERDSDVTWVLERSGVPFRMAAPHDRRAIAAAMRELVALAELRGARSARYPTSQFTREVLAGRLADLMNDCVATATKERRALRRIAAAR